MPYSLLVVAGLFYCFYCLVILLMTPEPIKNKAKANDKADKDKVKSS
jgi:hypothetical protein